MIGIDPTPFDVRLVAFGIPIRVHPSFWLGSVLFGSNLSSNQLIFIWVVCAFISILVHELGHALTAESFGWPSEIVMYFGGGLAISQRNRGDTPWRSILVSLMGPCAGFMLFGVVFLIKRLISQNHIWHAMDRNELEDDYRFYLLSALGFLSFMNLYWGLLNLLPVLPLDGGHIFESFCEAMHFRDASGLTLKVGAIVSGAAAYYFFTKMQQPYAGALMLMLCMESVGALQTKR
jgi:stage IV sporulation protein FB